jgi:hypothetical protein
MDGNRRREAMAAVSCLVMLTAVAVGQGVVAPPTVAPVGQAVVVPPVPADRPDSPARAALERDVTWLAAPEREGRGPGGGSPTSACSRRRGGRLVSSPSR